MKRLLSLLLTVALTAALMITTTSAADTSGFQTADFGGFVLGGQGVAIDPTLVENSAAVNALKTVLEGAGSKTNLPGGAQWLAWFQLEKSGGSGSASREDSSQSYRIYLSGGSAYIVYGEECRLVKAEDYRQFLASLDTRIYTGRAMGKIDLPSGAEPVVVQRTYSFRKLDGLYYHPWLAENPTIPTVEGASGKIELPQNWVPGALSVRVKQDGKILFEGTREEAQGYTAPRTGTYRVELIRTASHDYKAVQGTVTYAYNFRYGAQSGTQSAGGVQLTIKGNDTHLGEAVVLRATGVPKGAEIKVTTDLDFTPRFFDHPDGGRIALLPLHYKHATGNHWVEMSYGGVTKKYGITAKDKTWQIQNLTVDPNTTANTVESDKANAEYEQYIAPLRPVSDNQKYWSGRFILPCSDQKVTTQFGMIRYVNGAPTSVRHGALDLAVPRGTAVGATGNGRVLYSGFLQLTGNTILIEHGFGLKSWYYHMDSRTVSAGDMVQQGQKIGTVGSTGFSTGPHLHFGMSVNNVFINPYTAINTDLFE